MYAIQVIVLNSNLGIDLYHKYHENYTKPADLSPDKVFTCVSVLVKTPDNKISSTELSGCIPYSEHVAAIGANQRKQPTNNSSVKEENNEEIEGLSRCLVCSHRNRK